MEYFAGLDISMEETHVCVVDREGAVVHEEKSSSTPEAIAGSLAMAPACRRIVFETGRMAPMLYHGLTAFGLPVICIESRQAYQALKSLATHKTDRNDARGLAHLARTGFFKPTHVKSLPAHAVRALIIARKKLVGQREEQIAAFLASHGGPFYELQARLKLLHENALQSGTRAMLFVALAWGVPFLLGLPGSLSLDHDQRAYLTAPDVWAKFFVAIAAFVLAEQQVERGLRTKLTQFVRAPLIAPTSIRKAADAVTLALRQRDSRLAELICLVLALVAALFSYANFHTTQVSSWAVQHSPEGNAVTAAGWWTICVSLPLFIFLLLRGIWRHIVWAQLLRKIARMELRLVAAHPDGKGGLAFLAQYPNAYMFFVFGISSVIAAAVVKHMLQESLSMTTFSIVMGGWLAIVLAFFAYPLSAFSPPLAWLKENGLLLLGTQATRYHRLAERKVLGRNVLADATAELDEDIPDPTKLFETTRKLSSMLIDRTAVVPVAAAALIPFAIAGASKLPYQEVFSVLKNSCCSNARWSFLSEAGRRAMMPRWDEQIHEFTLMRGQHRRRGNNSTRGSRLRTRSWTSRAEPFAPTVRYPRLDRGRR